jgi:hypothetical protein
MIMRGCPSGAHLQVPSNTRGVTTHRCSSVACQLLSARLSWLNSPICTSGAQVHVPTELANGNREPTRRSDPLLRSASAVLTEPMMSQPSLHWSSGARGSGWPAMRQGASRVVRFASGMERDFSSDSALFPLVGSHCCSAYLGEH